MHVSELLACDGFQPITAPNGWGGVGHPVLAEFSSITGLPLVVRHVRSGIELFLVTPGRFLMGASGQEIFDAAAAVFRRTHVEIQAENERLLDLDKAYWMSELPEREAVPADRRVNVVVDTPFYMGCTEVSRQQWSRVMTFDHSPDTSLLAPVVNVAMEDAELFCAHAGGHITLPTDEQWEYVARAGRRTPFSRARIDTSQVNYDGEGDTMVGAAPGERRGASVEVGSLAANDWGFREMLGNVAEWVISKRNHPTELGWNQARGGSFDQPAVEARCASVAWYPPRHRAESIGFRVVKPLPMFRGTQ
jgi:formylglycine-generating enzyme required for sulfatase activity